MDEISINWRLMGAKLAILGDDEQSEFFTGFAKELYTFETHMKKEMQMISVGEKLSIGVKKVLEKYLPSLWEKE